jgi:hypothetical protein
MSSSSNDSRLQMPTSKHLSGARNYNQWKTNIELILKSKGLSKHITIDSGKPSLGSNKIEA